MIDLGSTINDYDGTLDILTEKTTGEDKQKIISSASEKILNAEKNIGKNTVNARSIVSRASKSVMQFPVYITQSIKAPEAHTIAKMFERVYASFVQTAFSQKQILTEDEANNLKFLGSYHTNIKDDGVSGKNVAQRIIMNEYYEPIDEVDRIMTESLYHVEDLGDGCYLEFAVVPTPEDMCLESVRLANDPLSGIRYLREESKIKEGLLKGLNKVTAASKKDDDDKTVSSTTTETEKRPVNSTATATKEQINRVAQTMKIEDYLKTQPIEKQHEAQMKELEKQLDAGRSFDLGKGQGNLYKDDKGNYKVAGTVEKSTSTSTRTDPKVTRQAVESPKLLNDRDIKKMNGMMPFAIEVTFKVKGHDDIRFLLGVKTIMHLINVNDLKDDLQEIITGSQKSLQKVRYKTGEISFVKDYLLNIKGLKSDAAKNLSSKKWLNTLKRLGEYEKLNGTLLKKGVEALAGGDIPIPNGTLVLTQDNVDALKQSTGIDLNSVSQVKTLAKRLFLIGVVVIDQIRGSMNVLFPDSDNDWDIQSIAAIDAETAKLDNSPLLNELNKIGRR